MITGKCRLCGQIHLTFKQHRSGAVIFCVCGHVMVVSGNIIRDINKKELDEPMNQACWKETRKKRERYCEQKGMFG